MRELVHEALDRTSVNMLKTESWTNSATLEGIFSRGNESSRDSRDFSQRPTFGKWLWTILEILWKMKILEIHVTNSSWSLKMVVHSYSIYLPAALLLLFSDLLLRAHCRQFLLPINKHYGGLSFITTHAGIPESESDLPRGSNLPGLNQMLLIRWMIWYIAWESLSLPCGTLYLYLDLMVGGFLIQRFICEMSEPTIWPFLVLVSSMPLNSTLSSSSNLPISV